MTVIVQNHAQAWAAVHVCAALQCHAAFLTTRVVVGRVLSRYLPDEQDAVFLEHAISARLIIVCTTLCDINIMQLFTQIGMSAALSAPSEAQESKTAWQSNHTLTVYS